MVVIGGYYCVRYYLIRHALREMNRDLQDVGKDISQNRIARLPLSDHALEQLMDTINHLLATIRQERLGYEQREKDFREQIENISHDLRTPLTVILGYLRLLKIPGAHPYGDKSTAITVIDGDRCSADTDLDGDRSSTGTNSEKVDWAEIREVLTIIERKTLSMEELVAQFYAYSRLSASDYELVLHEVELGRIVRETLIDHYQNLQAAHLTVNAAIKESPVWIKGDEAALERILANLFQNIERHAKSHLQITWTETEKAVTISFINDTDKLSANDLAHIFDRFYMNDQSRSAGGTGLGLTVARHLAEAMGGELTARMVRDGGCGGDRGEMEGFNEMGGMVVCFRLVLVRV
jgi:signal transduction histidine kinase